MVENKFGIKGMVGIVLIILFSIISFSTDYIHGLLIPTETEILLMTSFIAKDIFSGEVKVENIFLKATNNVKIDYEVIGGIEDWVSIEGPNNIEKEKSSRLILRIRPPKDISTNTYSGKILINFENKMKEIPVSLNVTHSESIKIQYGEKYAPFEIYVKINGTEFFGDLLDYINHSTCLKINLPEESEKVHVELDIEDDDDIDACIYSGNLDNPYKCSMRTRGRNESLTVIGIHEPLVVCIYGSEGQENVLIGNTANFSGLINFGMVKIENITNVTIDMVSGKILYVYTIHCKTCRKFASALVNFISDKNITLKFWTDDDADQPGFNKSVEKYTVGFYTPKDVDAIEATTESLLAEGCPDYAIDYLKNNLPSSYTCVCTVEGICDSFEAEGSIEQRLMQIHLHLKDLMAVMT